MPRDRIAVVFVHHMQAFGGLGILFPLIIPIVCQLTPGDDNSNTLRVQTAAAILSSTVLGYTRKLIHQSISMFTRVTLILSNTNIRQCMRISMSPDLYVCKCCEL